jgi:photosystem II stability/assembly factor-like uncharacterized protein
MAFIPIYTGILVWGCASSSPECDPARPCADAKVCLDGRCVATLPDGAIDGELIVGEKLSSDGGEGVNTTDKELISDQTSKPPDEEQYIIYRWQKVEVPLAADLYAVSMPTENDIWAVGQSGMIFYSGDYGTSWQVQKSGSTAALYAASFIDSKNGWIGGEEGTIFRTRDGGKTWTKLSVPAKGRIHGIKFRNDQFGYVVGERFTFLVTRESGDRWDAKVSELNVNLHALDFFNNQTGYVVGSNGMIFVTRDGGNQITTAVTGTDRNLWAVQFIGEVGGWVVGDTGFVRYTDNQGESWRQRDVGTQEHLYSVAFASQHRAWIVGANGTLMGTRDGGQTWRNESIGLAADLRAIAAYSPQRGVIVGKSGTILVLREAKGECQPGQKRACYSGPPQTLDVGRCKAGEQICEGGIWEECKGESLPAAEEICFNDQDDNCNGKSDIDDGCPVCQESEKRSCYTGQSGTIGIGICRAGQQICKDKQWAECLGEILPQAEDCNGKDDNCDGEIDNNISDANRPLCELQHGVCAKSRKICQGGKWLNCDETQYGEDYEKKESKCDGKDNDCDGLIDVGCPCTSDGETRPCYTGPTNTKGQGICKAGQQICIGNKWSNCRDQLLPVAEICDDQIDNDCDGQIDEKTQYALSFNNQQRTHLEVKSDPALEPTDGLTTEGWFYFDSINNRTARTLLSKTENGGYGLYIDLSRSGELSFRVWPRNSKTYVSVAANYANKLHAQQWTHIAGTFNGKQLAIWLNGQRLASQNIQEPIAYTIPNVPLIIGAEAAASGIATNAMAFSGMIAEVKISGKALYDRDFTPPCQHSVDTDTIALWLLDEGSGDALSDVTQKHPAISKNTLWLESIRCPGFFSGGCK